MSMNTYSLHAALGLSLVIAFSSCLSASTVAGFTQLNFQEPEDNTPDQDKSLPSLDELLGIDDGAETKDEVETVDPNDAELDRVLSPQQAGQAFTQAIGLMDQVAARIENQNDLSIDRDPKTPRRHSP